MRAAHLFVDVSAHGFGHLAQVAPVLNALAAHLPSLRITLRSALSTDALRARLSPTFTHLADSSDFGYVMHDAVHVDLPATAAAYRRQHADWEARVTQEARRMAELRPDLVLSDVSYLPLAGAARLGVPSLAMCSLNWADLFAHFFGGENWATAIHQQMVAAYRAANAFLRLIPGMAMPDLPHVRSIAPVAALGRDCRQALRTRLRCAAEERVLLIGFGGVAKQLPIADWPVMDGVRWLVPRVWRCELANTAAIESQGLSFTDLLASVDAVLTKPGYGMFTEAACHGTPVLYLRRPDWPEQDCLIDWLHLHARCHEVSEEALQSGRLGDALAALWRQTPLPPPSPLGAEEAARLLLPWLTVASPVRSVLPVAGGSRQ